jgi:CO dehydrogenase maturation factor
MTDSNMIIATSGKGGVGKTTIIAMLLKYILEKNPKETPLIIDADPASNIPDVVGAKLNEGETVGAIALALKQQIEKGTLPPERNKVQVLEGGVFGILKELDRFDMLVMGRPEGEGCYCFINSVLTGILDKLSKNYHITLMDMEAGLEHVSRRTGRDVDFLIIVSDPSKMGVQTAERIIRLAKEVKLAFKHIWVVGNRFPDAVKPQLEKMVQQIQKEGFSAVTLAGFVPNDDQIAEFNFAGRSLLELPATNPAYMAFEEIAKKFSFL